MHEDKIQLVTHNVLHYYYFMVFCLHAFIYLFFVLFFVCLDVVQVKIYVSTLPIMVENKGLYKGFCIKIYVAFKCVLVF